MNDCCDNPKHAWYPMKIYGSAIAILLFAAFMLCGCEKQAPLRIKLIDERIPDEEALQDELYDEVLDACDILQLDCEAADEAYGAVTLLIFEMPAKKGTKGRGFITAGCHRAAWGWNDGKEHLIPFSHVYAHEIGHTLFGDGEHEEAPNLMDPGSSVPDLTEKQRKTLQRKAWSFYLGCNPP